MGKTKIETPPETGEIPIEQEKTTEEKVGKKFDEIFDLKKYKDKFKDFSKGEKKNINTALLELRSRITSVALAEKWEDDKIIEKIIKEISDNIEEITEGEEMEPGKKRNFIRIIQGICQEIKALNSIKTTKPDIVSGPTSDQKPESNFEPKRTEIIKDSKENETKDSLAKRIFVRLEDSFKLRLKKIEQGTTKKEDMKIDPELYLDNFLGIDWDSLQKSAQDEIMRKCEDYNLRLIAKREEKIKGKDASESGKNNEFAISIKGAEITLERISNYEELNAETEQKGDERFLQRTRELWKEFAVHGTLQKNEKTREIFLTNYTDLDGKCALGLLELAGINIKDIKYVNPGDYEEGRINLDTGNKEGIIVEGKTVFIDHNGEFSESNTSTAEKTYQLLVALGLLEKSKYLNNLVKFVNQIDNGNYPGADKYFKNSWKTVSGLNRFLDFKRLKRFFEQDKNPDPARELSEAELRKYGFIYEKKKRDVSGESKSINYSERQKDIAEKSHKALQDMEKGGLVINSDKYGKIAVEINDGAQRSNPGGYIAAKAYGCNTYVIWNASSKSFFVCADRKLQEEFSQGKKIRDRMWIKPMHDKSELTITLEEILSKMTDGKFAMTEEFEKHLGKKENIEKLLEPELVNKIIEKSRKFRKVLLGDLEKSSVWNKYKKETQNDIISAEMEQTIKEMLDSIIKEKKIEEKQIDIKGLIKFIIGKI